jgi:hypothetical protein
VVAYVNGVEVARVNVGPGPPAHASYASGVFSTATDSTTVRSVVVGPGVLTPGANAVAVVLKQGSPSSLDLLLDASVTVYTDAAPVVAV